MHHLFLFLFGAKASVYPGSKKRIFSRPRPAQAATPIVSFCTVEAWLYCPSISRVPIGSRILVHVRRCCPDWANAPSNHRSADSDTGLSTSNISEDTEIVPTLPQARPPLDWALDTIQKQLAKVLAATDALRARLDISQRKRFELEECLDNLREEHARLEQALLDSDQYEAFKLEEIGILREMLWTYKTFSSISEETRSAINRLEGRLRLPLKPVYLSINTDLVLNPPRKLHPKSPQSPFGATTESTSALTPRSTPLRWHPKQRSTSTTSSGSTTSTSGRGLLTPPGSPSPRVRAGPPGLEGPIPIATNARLQEFGTPRFRPKLTRR